MTQASCIGSDLVAKPLGFHQASRAMLGRVSLSAKQIAAAQVANPYFIKRWCIDLAALSLPPIPDSAALAEAVAGHQRRWQSELPHLQLQVDGILGPSTLGLYQQGQPYRAAQAPCFWVAGQPVPTTCAVISYHQLYGFGFYDHQPALYTSRQSRLNLLVLHWDECHSSQMCFAVLLQRGLSVHLLLDSDGSIYQTLDLQTDRAFHARQANDRSIGIEICNPVHLKPHVPPLPPRTLVTEHRPHDGRLWQHYDFTDAQKKVLPTLVRELCRILAIPLRLPWQPNGAVEPSLLAADYSGICGHYHLTTDKIDPGFSLWPLLQNIG